MNGKFLGIVRALVLLGLSAETLADPYFEVVVQLQPDKVERGVATLVTKDTLITSNALISLNGVWKVKFEGDTEVKLLTGTVLYRDVDSDIALIQVSGISGDPITLATSMPDTNRMVEVRRFDSHVAKGMFARSISVSEFEHSAVFTDINHGAVVINNCGEAIGINKSSIEKHPKLTKTKTRLRPIGNPPRATSLEAIKHVLGAAGVNAQVSDKACLSSEQQIIQSKQEQEKLEKELEEGKTALEKATVEKKRAVEEAKRHTKASEEALAKARAKQAETEEQAKKDREEIEAQAEREKDELKGKAEARKAELDKEKAAREKWMLWAAALTIGTACIALFSSIAIRRRQKAVQLVRDSAEKIQKELDAASVTHPDIVLHGEFPDGRPARLKINGDALVRSKEGQIIGRDPELSDLVLSHSEISRRHLRIDIKNGAVRVEELGSFNGAAINGRALDVGVPVEIRNNDVLRIGTTELRVVVTH